MKHENENTPQKKSHTAAGSHQQLAVSPSVTKRTKFKRAKPSLKNSQKINKNFVPGDINKANISTYDKADSRKFAPKHSETINFREEPTMNGYTSRAKYRSGLNTKFFAREN